MSVGSPSPPSIVGNGRMPSSCVRNTLLAGRTILHHAVVPVAHQVHGGLAVTEIARGVAIGRSSKALLPWLKRRHCRKSSPALTNSDRKAFAFTFGGSVEAILAGQPNDQLAPPEVGRPPILGAERERSDAGVLELALQRGNRPRSQGSPGRRRPARTAPCCTTARLPTRRGQCRRCAHRAR